MTSNRLYVDDKQIIAYSKFNADEILREVRQERMLKNANISPLKRKLALSTVSLTVLITILSILLH